MTGRDGSWNLFSRYIHFSVVDSSRGLLIPVAVSSYAQSCKASAKSLEKESSHPMYCRGTATLHMVSAHIPVPATTVWHADRQKVRL